MWAQLTMGTEGHWKARDGNAKVSDFALRFNRRRARHRGLLVKETLLAAWRGLDQFAEQASIRSWLYIIATNRSVDALRANARRPRRLEPMTEPPTPTRVAEPIWLEPYPDVLIEGIADEALGPAEILDTSEAAVNSLLRRARVALESRLPAAGRERAPLPNSRRQREVVGQFANAIEDGDVDAVVALLTDDAWLTMPPESRAARSPRSPFLPTAACSPTSGSPAPCPNSADEAT
jgi:DNA-directed RNA polymerase specialized sigma24 family protein